MLIFIKSEYTFSKKELISLILILLSLAAQSQQLMVGDQMPQVSLDKVLNYDSDKLRISELNEKNTIFYFWSTDCISCLQSFPKIDTLNKEFHSQIQLIIVCNQRRTFLDSFFSNFQNVHLPFVPCVVEDTLLSSFFPRTYNPWVVWLDKSMVIKYISDGTNLTKENIMSFIASKPLDIPQLTYVKKDYTYSKPLIIFDDGKWLDKVPFYSLISHHIPGTNADNLYQMKTIYGTLRITRNARSAIELIESAFNEGEKYAYDLQNCVELKLFDSLKFVKPKEKALYDKWAKNFCYDYDLAISEDKKDQMYKIMQNDFINFFNLQVKIEKKTKTCLVFIKTKNMLNPFKETINSINDTAVYLCKNETAVRITRALQHFSNMSSLNFPIVDGTNNLRNISLTIKFAALKPFDLNKINQGLKKYGYQLTTRKIPIDILSIEQLK